IAFHPTLPLVFVANELDSTVATLRFDAGRGTLSPLDSLSTVPAGWTGTNYPADIHVASSGRTLYVSNRGHNSIAVFSVAESTGALVLDPTVSTEGDWPRNFSLDPTGRWLLAANQPSDSGVVFGPAPGEKGVGSRFIKERETLAPSFHVGLLFCPTDEKGLGMKGRWEPVQLVNFSRREKAPGDCGPIGLLPDQFDINANLAILGDRD